MDSQIILNENPYDEWMSLPTVLMGLIKAVERCKIYQPNPERDPDVAAVALELEERVTPGVFAMLLSCRFALVVPQGQGASIDEFGRNEIAFAAVQYRPVRDAECDDGWLVALCPADDVDLAAFRRLVAGSTEDRPWMRGVSALVLRHEACAPFETVIANEAFDALAAAGAGTIALDERDDDDGIPIHLDLENVQPIARLAPIRKEAP